jgi:RHS repeat-associated protein
VVSYDVWGVPTFATAGVDAVAGFSGEVQDAGAGLVGFHARSYEPVTGSWLSADPYRGELGSPQTLGRYQYVGNNPATSRDLLGYMFQMSDWGTAPPGWKPGHPAPKRTTPPSRVWDNPPKVFSPWSAYKPTVRHENWDGDATCDAYDRRGTCIAHLTPQQRDQAQDIGAVIGGILIGAAITGGIIAAAGCTLASAGICGAVILGAGALGGAATGAAICDWKSGQHTTEQCLGEGLAAAPTGALGGAIGIAASKAPALIAASTKSAQAASAGAASTRLALQHVTNSGETVLGSYPGYIDAAKSSGASYFDIGESQWNAIVARGEDPWALNQAFLDNRIAAGDRVVLSTDRSEVGFGTYLAREVQYLESHGYRWVDDRTLVSGKE